MATKTAGIRIEEAQFDKFNEIKDTFPKASDFANWIISAYSKYESEHTADLFTSEIENLSKTLEALMNGVHRISSLSSDIVHNKDVQVQSTLDDYAMRIEEYKTEIEELKQSAIDKEKESTLALSEKEKQLNIAETFIKSLEEQISDYAYEIDTLKKDIGVLSRLNDLLEKDKHAYERVISENQELEKELSKHKIQLADAEKSLFESNNQVKELQAKNDALIAEHKKELELLEKMHTLDISQASVNATTKFQEQIEHYISREEELRKQIDILQKENLFLSKSK